MMPKLGGPQNAGPPSMRSASDRRSVMPVERPKASLTPTVTRTTQKSEGRRMLFENTITTLDELREAIAPPSELVTAKEVATFDDYCRDFIARSPFVLIASSDGEGSIDISPKGDPPGFVQVLDDRTLAIPDRPGNHRADAS